MLANADGLIAFRTYPHVDMAATGERAAAFLNDCFNSGIKPHHVARRLPFLIPINAMCTLLEPARDTYQQLEHMERSSGVALSFAPGFPAADFPECGPVIWGYGKDAAVVERTVDSLYQELLARENAWRVEFMTPDAAVLEAQRIAQHASRPVVIADTQDNPGAGGDSNTTGMLRALIRCKAQGAALGLLFDPAAAALAHQSGVGSDITLALGGQSGTPGDEPLHATFHVEYLADGSCRLDGPMMNGMQVELGPVACLRIDDIRIAVSWSRSPCKTAICTAPRHCTGADEDSGQQEFGPFPRRLPADCRKRAGSQVTGAIRRRLRRFAVDPAGGRDSHESWRQAVQGWPELSI